MAWIQKKKTKKGKIKYYVRYYVKDRDKFIERSGGSFDYSSDAKAAKNQIELALKAGEPIDAEPASGYSMDITVAQYCEIFIDTYCRQLSPNYRADLKNSINNHIVPQLGNIKFRQLSTLHIQTLYNNMQDTYYRQPKFENRDGVSIMTFPGKRFSPSQIDHVHKALCKIINKAMAETPPLLEKNPALATDRPKVEYTVTDPPPAKMIGKLLELMSGDEIFEAILACGLLAFRRGETLGLWWTDINFKNNVIKPERQFKPNNETGGQEIGELKTKASKQSVPIPELLAYHLKLLKAKRERLERERPDIYARSPFVFVDGAGMPIKPDRISRTFKRYARKAGLPNMRLHDLRHAAGTYLLESGESVKTVQGALRLASPDMLLKRYAHIIDESQKRAASAMSGLYLSNAGIMRDTDADAGNEGGNSAS